MRRGVPQPKNSGRFIRAKIAQRLGLGLGIVHAGLTSLELFTLTSRAESRQYGRSRAGR